MNSEDNIKKIAHDVVAYVDGELSQKERELFDNKLASDANLLQVVWDVSKFSFRSNTHSDKLKIISEKLKISN